MKEQRKFVRRILHSNVSVFSSDDQFIGTMMDFSEGGILVSSYQPIEVGTSAQLVMVDLPNNIGRKRTGHINVKTVRCDVYNGTMFGIGYSLVDADDQAKEMFTSYDDGHAPK